MIICVLFVLSQLVCSLSSFALDDIFSKWLLDVLVCHNYEMMFLIGMDNALGCFNICLIVFITLYN
jgi:hypothetical protein